MEMFGKTLCVTRNELVLGGIVSPATYDKYVNNGKFIVARRGCRSREALFMRNYRNRFAITMIPRIPKLKNKSKNIK